MARADVGDVEAAESAGWQQALSDSSGESGDEGGINCVGFDESSSDEEHAIQEQKKLARSLSQVDQAYLKECITGLYCMYALVGLVNGFFSHYINIPLCQYVFGPMGAAGRTTVQQCDISATVIQMPWNYKVFYGFLLDRYALCGSPRRLWIIFGWTVALALLGVVSLFAERLREDGDFSTYSLLLMCLCAFYMISDVAGDGMTIELTKLEPEEVRGHILTTGQMIRFLMTTGVNVLGIVAMNGESYYPPDQRRKGSTVFPFELSFSMVHIVLFVLCVPPYIAMVRFLHDPPRDGATEERHSKTETLKMLWKIMQSKVMLFLIVFSVGSIALSALSNPAANIIANIAAPSTLQSSVGGAFGNALFITGVYLFRQYLMNTNWRFTFVWTSLLVLLNLGFQCLVIFDAWGVGQDGWFFVFGSNILSLIQGVAQVLGSLAIAEMSPSGLEATVYELLTTMHNAAMALNVNLQNLFIPIFNLHGINHLTYFANELHPNPPQAEYNVRMLKATLFTLVVSVVATIVFALFFPKDKAQTRRWRDDARWHRPAVGWLGLVIAVSCFLFSTLVSFLSLFPSTMCLQIAGGPGCDSRD